MSREGQAPHVISGITAMGTMRLLRPTIDEMNSRGWRTQVVVSPGEDHGFASGVDVIEVPMTRSLSPREDLVALGRWVRLLRHERPDIVIGSTAKAATLSMTAARIAGVPSRVLLLRGARWDGMTGRRADLLRRVDAWNVSQSTHTVAVSDSLADLFVDSGLSPKRPVVLGRGGSKGVDVSRFHPSPELIKGPPIIGFVGRLSQDKGIRDLLAAYALCREEVPGARLVVVGDVDAAQPIDPGLKSALAGDDVEWLGHSTRVHEIMPSFDVLMFPSIREGLPNVVLEAAACGVPTSAYDTTGVRDAVIDGVTGRLVPLGDVRGLAQATLAILAAGTNMREAARQFAVEWFDQDKVVRRFVDYVQKQWESRPS